MNEEPLLVAEYVGIPTLLVLCLVIDTIQEDNNHGDIRRQFFQPAVFCLFTVLFKEPSCDTRLQNNSSSNAEILLSDVPPSNQSHMANMYKTKRYTKVYRDNVTIVDFFLV